MADADTENLSDSDFVAEDDIQPDLFEVSVKGAGVALTRTVDQTTALSVIATVLGGAASAPSAAYAPQTPSTSRVGVQRNTRDGTAAKADQLDPHMTVGEYIDDCNARRFPAKITAIGNFLQLKLEQSSFTRDEVKSQFRAAGEVQPGNYAIAQRWIAEDPNAKGQYFVTRTGKNAIAEKFDKPLRRAPTRRKKATTKSDNGDTSSTDNTDLEDLDDDE